MRLQLLTPPVWTATGTLTTSAATVSSLAGIAAAPFPDVSLTPFVGQPVSGTGVPDGTTVLSIQSSAALTLSANATATGSKTLTFGVEPVTLTEAKAWCRVQFTDNDSLISTLITAARRYVETRLRQALITQTWRLYLDSFPSAGGYYNLDVRRLWVSGGDVERGSYAGLTPNSSGVIDVPMSPLQSVTSVKYLDFQGNTQTVSSSVYNVAKGIVGRIQPGYSQVWPISRPTIDAVYVDFVAGYGPTAASISSNVKTAMNYMIYNWYENPQPLLSGRYTIVPGVVDDLLTPDDPGAYI